MDSRFQGVEQGPPIEVFQLMKLFAEDTHLNKVNLSVGGMYVIIYLYSSPVYYFTVDKSHR